MIAFLFEHLGGWLAAAGALIAVGVGALLAGRKQGRHAAEIEAMTKDQKDAEALRTRLDTDRAARLRANDDAGFRD